MFIRKLLLPVVLVLPLLGVLGLLALAENNTSGTGAGSRITTGDENILYGSHAGHTLTSGSGNTFVGYSSGYSGYSTTGSVKLGYMAGYSDTTSNKLMIVTGFYPSYGIFGLFNSGYFGVNTTTPTCSGRC